MNIPRQFYGLNYISRILEQLKDRETTECPKLSFHAVEGKISSKLIPKTTAELSLNAERLTQFFLDITTSPQCAIDGLAICKGEHLVFSAYRPPYHEENPHVTNSTCKTVTAIAIMFALSEHLLSEEDKVISFFPEYDTLLTPKFVKMITVRHLLTMTTSSKCNEIASVTEKNWVKAFLLSDCQYEPGTQCVYNSMNTYMLAAILTKITGRSLMDYLEERLWNPLGISDVKWELCPNGIERGGWGLHLSLHGMLKIGLFLAQDGFFGGKQLLQAEYVKKIKQTVVPQTVDSLSTGYGYQIWHLPNNLYLLSGMYGQHVIIDETHNMIVATNAHCDKLFPDCDIVAKTITLLTDSSLYHSQNILLETMYYKRLLQQVKAFSMGDSLKTYRSNLPFFMYKALEKRKQRKKKSKLVELLNLFDGKQIKLEQPIIKLFPFSLQGMYQIPPFPVSDIAFERKEDTMEISFYKEKNMKESGERKRERIQLLAGCQAYHMQEIMIGEQKREVAVKIFCATDEEEKDVVLIDIVFPDAGISRVIKFFLQKNRICIESLEYPDLCGIMEQVLFGETVLAGTKIDLTDKLPQSVRFFIEREVEPKVNAYFQ